MLIHFYILFIYFFISHTERTVLLKDPKILAGYKKVILLNY